MGKIGKVFLGLFIFGFACYLITRMSGPLISSANSNGNTIGAGQNGLYLSTALKNILSQINHYIDRKNYYVILI